MKSILIIGLGRFGTHLCQDLAKLDNEIMIVDKDEASLEDLLPLVVSAKIGDCTNEKVLKSLGVGNFDYCFVCIGENFQSSLEITSLLKDLGAKYVVSKANRDIHAKFLLRNGADEVIYPGPVILQKKLQSVFLQIRSLTMWNSEIIFPFTKLPLCRNGSVIRSGTSMSVSNIMQISSASKLKTAWN